MIALMLCPWMVALQASICHPDNPPCEARPDRIQSDRRFSHRLLKMDSEAVRFSYSCHSRLEPHRGEAGRPNVLADIKTSVRMESPLDHAERRTPDLRIHEASKFRSTFAICGQEWGLLMKRIIAIVGLCSIGAFPLVARRSGSRRCCSDSCDYGQTSRQFLRLEGPGNRQYRSIYHRWRSGSCRYEECRLGPGHDGEDQNRNVETRHYRHQYPCACGSHRQQ